jgi:hypothetical protein
MLSALGRYRAIKTQRGALLAVGGCVAQQEKGKLLARVPYLDFVFGPDAIGKLPSWSPAWSRTGCGSRRPPGSTPRSTSSPAPTRAARRGR